MKTSIKFLIIWVVTIVNFGFWINGATAQNFTTLYCFTPLLHNTNNDGCEPSAKLILSGNILYGTANYGGNSGSGTVFTINTNGTGFVVLHDFTSAAFGPYTNSDGYAPHSLILSGNTLYGVAGGGGRAANGTIFEIYTNGTGFTNLYNFSATFLGNQNTPAGTNYDGAGPYGELILSGNSLYGTAEVGGNAGNGTVFKINADGTGFMALHSFTAEGINSDGANPFGGLVLSGSTLYGTTLYGGSFGWGTVFAVNTDGTGFTNLYSFTARSVSLQTNSDGASPNALILSNNILYGTARFGGKYGNGTVFALNTNGSNFTTLHSFDSVNGDGANPESRLFLSGNVLYGTAHAGGSGNGTVFAINTDGSAFTNLFVFTAFLPQSDTNQDGAYPVAGLNLSDNTFYGVALGGGNSGNGTIFSISIPPPPLTIIHSATNVILMWPTYAPGITLEFTTNLLSQTTWNTNLPLPVLVNGQNAVTNPISSTQKFFRLSQ